MASLLASVKSKTDKLTDKTNNTLAEVVDTVSKSVNQLEKKIDTETPYWLTLNKIGKDEYFPKCLKLCEEFKNQNINRESPIMQIDTQNDWNKLRSAAEKLQEPLREAFMENLVNHIQENNKNIDNIQIHQASLKRIERAKEKVETDYDGNWRRLLDVCRGAIVHETFQDLFYILQFLLKHHNNCFGFKIIRVKNRYSAPTHHGWADIHVLIEPIGKEDTENESEENKSQFVEYPKHICEIQFAHIAMWDKRKDSKLYGHSHYKRSRGYNNSLQKGAQKVGGSKGKQMMNKLLDKKHEIQTSIGTKMFIKKTTDDTSIDSDK